MRDDLLVGGPGMKRRRKRERQEPMAPPLVGWKFLLVVFGVAGVVGGLGIWQVDTTFQIRDHEIETQRLQEIAARRRERARVLETRISQLQRSDVLRAAAVDTLGMQIPEPNEIETIVVPAEVQERWDRAAERTIGARIDGKEEG